MKQQRFTTALLNQSPSRKEQIIQWLDEYLHWIVCAVITACVWGVALIGLSLSRPTLAVDTDYNNNAVSEQISAEWERKAKAEWIAEFGDVPPNLTTEGRVYLEQETARLQGLRNGK
jgi:hypothetical protein|nr:MAG TPA: hypothetical protein [Caudoviricetes sp.]